MINTDNGKMQFLRKIKDTYNFKPYLNIQNDQHECHNYIEGRNYMHNFIKEKIDLNFYDSLCSSQLQKLKYLFKFGELSSLNSIGKYIFESFKSRDKQS